MNYLHFLESIRSRRKPIAAAIGIILLVVAGARLMTDSKSRKDAPVHSDIVMRGRIKPASRVIALGGAISGGTVRELRVVQGQSVSANDIVAVLEGYAVNLAAQEVAEKSLNYAEMQKLQTTASAKTSEVAAQRHLVAAKEAELERLRTEMARRESLAAKGVSSAQMLDNTRAEFLQAQNTYQQAQNTLKALTEFRSVDEAAASARVELERASLKRAQAELERTVVRAPFDGEILSIHTRPGEVVGADGIVRMANRSDMLAIAEVDEHFYPRLTKDMRVWIEGSFIQGKVEAEISDIAGEIFKQKRPVSDVLIGRDARIVEVELRPKTPLPPLIGGEVTVRFADKQR
jgi:HlyD family secretion protein